MKLHEIARFVDGNLLGDGEVVIERICPIEEAGAGDLTFLANPQYRKRLKEIRASAVLIASEPPGEASGVNFIIVPDPYVALGKLLAVFYPEDRIPSGISQNAFLEEGAIIATEAAICAGVTVCKGARIERGAVLYPGVFVGPEAVIGEDSILYPNVCIYRKCLIGRRVILHAGVVIGSDGFGFANPGVDNLKIPQVGFVQIDDDVEIGANTTIDRGTLGKTWVKRGVKIDNLVQIAHNVVVGEKSVIVSQVGIAGSTKLGRSVIIGGQAGLVGHIAIGDNVMIGAKSGIHESIADGQVVSGHPQLPHKEWLRVAASLSRLPEMRKSQAVLLEKIAKLEEEMRKIKNHEDSCHSNSSTRG